MTLREYLEEVKTGRNQIAIVTSSDDDFGTTNYNEGKYIAFGDNWDCYDASEYIDDLGELYADCLDREIIEVDALPSKAQLLRWFNGNTDEDMPHPDIVICVKGYSDDDDYWEEDEEESEEATPQYYRFITEEQIKKANDIFWKRVVFEKADYSFPGDLFRYWLVETLIKNGLDSVKNITFEQIEDMAVEAKEKMDAAKKEGKFIVDDTMYFGTALYYRLGKELAEVLNYEPNALMAWIRATDALSL